MFRFAEPAWLNALWLLPVWLATGWWLALRAQRRVERFTSPRLAPALTLENSAWRLGWGRMALTGALVALIVGLARPQTALPQAETASRGLEIMFLIDTSGSMRAQDVKPNRLGRARRALAFLISRLAGNPMGIVQFSGEPFVACPLTRDTGALLLIADRIEELTLPVAGTDLGQAIEYALEASARTGARHQALVILTDGENFGQEAFGAVQRAAESGVRTFTLGVGTPQGAPVPPASPGGLSPGTTRLDEAALKYIAQLSGGRYEQLTAGGQEEEALLAEVAKLEKMEQTAGQFQAWQEQFPWAAGLAAFLLLADALLGRRRGRPWFAGRGGRWVLAGGVAAFCLMAPSAWAGGRDWLRRGEHAFRQQDWKAAERWFEKARRAAPGHPVAEYNFGCALLYQYKFSEALPAFIRARQKARGRLRENCWYNSGYTAFYLGLQEGAGERWREAAEGFKHVLLLNPGDEDARYNLEMILREMARQTQPRARREEQSQGQTDGQKAGGGAEKPGPDRMRHSGRENPDAAPAEAEEETRRREKGSARAQPSEARSGHRSRGLSREQALRVLRSLEEHEQLMQQPLAQGAAESTPYRGPEW